jgi:hypothetical protein
MEDNNADCLLCNPAQDFGNSSPTGRPHGLLAKDPAPLDPWLTPSLSPKIAMRQQLPHLLAHGDFS